LAHARQLERAADNRDRDARHDDDEADHEQPDNDHTHEGDGQPDRHGTDRDPDERHPATHRIGFMLETFRGNEDGEEGRAQESEESEGHSQRISVIVHPRE